MAGIEDVLERLVTEPAFARQLQTDPQQALSGYVLDREDLDVLAAQLNAEAGVPGGVEQRTSKSTFAGLLDAFGGLAAEGGGVRGGGADAGDSSKGDAGPNVRGQGSTDSVASPGAGGSQTGGSDSTEPAAGSPTAHVGDSEGSSKAEPMERWFHDFVVQGQNDVGDDKP